MRCLLLLAAFLVLSWSFFGWIPGRNVLLAADALRLLPPWQRPGPLPQNPLLTDPLWQFFPWLTEFRQAILSLRFPLWDPTIECGVPLAANPVSAFFFPLTWLVLPLGVAAGMSAITIVRPALAAFFTFLYLRKARRSLGAAFFGALVFGFSLPFMVWAEHPHDNVFLAAPLLLLAIDAAVRRPGVACTAGVALAISLVLLGGHPESAFHVLVLGGAYALIQVIRHRRRRRRAALGLALAAIWSAALTVFFLLPQSRILLASADLRGSGHPAPPMPLRMIVGALLPRFFVAGPWHVSAADVPWNLNESACYYGVAALALAAVALRKARRASPIPGVGFWAAVLGSMFFLVFAAPRFAFFQQIPILGQIYHNRLTVLAGLAVAVLASQAVDDLWRSGARRLAFGATLLGAAGLAIILPPVLCGRRATLDQVLLTGAMAVASGAAALLTKRRRVAIALLCAASFADLWVAGFRYHPLVAHSEIYPPIESAKQLQALQGHGRVLPLGVTFPPNSLSVYGVRDVRGNDAVESLRYFRARNNLAKWIPGAGMPEVFVGGLTSDTVRMLPIFGVRALVLPPGMTLDPASLPGLGGSLETVYRGPDATIYRIARAPGRFQIMGRIVPAGAKVADPRRESSVEGISEPVDFPLARRAAARIARDDPEEIDLITSSPGPFFLRISDTYDDGWRAIVDRRPLALHRVDANFRGVILPAGTHRLALRYRLPGSPGTVACAIVAWALLFWMTLKKGSSLRPG